MTQSGTDTTAAGPHAVPVPARPKSSRIRCGASMAFTGPWLAAATLLASQGACAQERITHLVPAPAGTATFGKVYFLVRQMYTGFLLTGPREGVVKEEQLFWAYIKPGFADGDGIVAGWSGGERLTIGWPAGYATEPGPTKIGSVEIAYINYETDLANAKPHQIDQVTLRDVTYTTETASTDFGVSCTIRVRGTDGRFFREVSTDVIGGGYYHDREPGRLGRGSMTLKFSLSRLPRAGSPLLTPTQAKLGTIPPHNSNNTSDAGAIQDGDTLKYRGYNQSDAENIFRLLHDGGYVIRFSLTFGERQVEYLVREPISAEAAAAYQQCEARTWIFSRLLGSILSN